MSERLSVHPLVLVPIKQVTRLAFSEADSFVLERVNLIRHLTTI